jgi:hypothetical protein
MSETTNTGEGVPGEVGTDPLAEMWLTKMAGESSAFSESSYKAESFSETEGHARGGAKSISTGETIVPFLKPVNKEQISSETEWSREEKVSRIAQTLKYQAERHCFIRLDTEKTEAICVPNVFMPQADPEALHEYEKTTFRRQGSLSAAEVDRLLLANEKECVLRASGSQQSGTARGSQQDDDSPFE